jgi:hypothetical protein
LERRREEEYGKKISRYKGARTLWGSNKKMLMQAKQ